jgi:saccharopine dehydrogenase-like NADP-dependent oxidoreductase
LRVLALGGAGRVGRRAVGILASSSLVSEIVIAGGNLEAAQSCANDTGEKARAVSVDISNQDRLVTLARDCDILVNTAGPEFEVALKALGAAIMAGTNYCDISADGPTMEKTLELDSAAKAKGVTALMGIGHMPGLTNLMMMHAARQLDSAEEVRTCVFAAASAQALGWMKDELARYRETGHVVASSPMFVKLATPPFHVYPC